MQIFFDTIILLIQQRGEKQCIGYMMKTVSCV